MRLMTFKISKSLLEEMDNVHKEHHYANRTEFIRAAIRDKIENCKAKKHPHKAQEKGKRVEYTG